MSKQQLFHGLVVPHAHGERMTAGRLFLGIPPTLERGGSLVAWCLCYSGHVHYEKCGIFGEGKASLYQIFRQLAKAKRVNLFAMAILECRYSLRPRLSRFSCARVLLGNYWKAGHPSRERVDVLSCAGQLIFHATCKTAGEQLNTANLVGGQICSRSLVTGMPMTRVAAMYILAHTHIMSMFVDAF